MHYYQFNIGDYSKDAKHLSLEEDAIYRRLIDLYYLDEEPIPLDINLVSRKILARGKEDLILIILSEFFKKTDKGFEHSRIKKEIKNFKNKQKKRSDAAKSRWAMVSSDASAMQMHTKSNANHKPITINHKPITINHKPITNNHKDQEIHSEHNKVDVHQERVPFKKIIELWNEKMCPDLLAVKTMTPGREGSIRQRWNNNLPDMENWNNFFDYIKQSPFLMGKIQGRNGNKPFRASFDWVIKPANYAKIYEGHYHE